jgi:hypothetical protein
MALRAATLAAVAALAASAPPSLVWSGAAPAVTLSVYSDDTYSIALNGTTLFVSAPTAIHVNSTWFTSLAAPPAPPGPSACAANLTNTDCRGNDLFYFNTTSVQECCANCSATPACGAWTYTGETEALGAAPPYWAQRCYIKSSCAPSAYSGHTSGTQQAGGGATPLARLGAGPLAGQHATLGAYTGWEVRYAAGGTPLTTAFLFFPAGQGLFLFNLTLPAGAAGMSLLTPGGGGGGGEFDSSLQPTTQFPALALAPGLGAPPGHVSWAGRFFSETSGAWGGGSSDAQGAEGGPLAFFDASSSSSSSPQPPTLVLAPFAHFKGVHAGGGAAGTGAPPATLALGLNSYVPALPPGFTVSVSLSGSLGGVTDAVHAWGAALLASRGTVRAQDPSATQLTYWTDNGVSAREGAPEKGVRVQGLPHLHLPPPPNHTFPPFSTQAYYDFVRRLARAGFSHAPAPPPHMPTSPPPPPRSDSTPTSHR